MSFNIRGIFILTQVFLGNSLGSNRLLILYRWDFSLFIDPYHPDLHSVQFNPIQLLFLLHFSYIKEMQRKVFHETKHAQPSHQTHTHTHTNNRLESKIKIVIIKIMMARR